VRSAACNAADKGSSAFLTVLEAPSRPQIPRAGLRKMLFAAHHAATQFTSPVSRRQSLSPRPQYAAAGNAGELSRASEAVRPHHRFCRGFGRAVNNCSGTAQANAFISSTRLVIAPIANCTRPSGSAWSSASCPQARAKSLGYPRVLVAMD